MRRREFLAASCAGLASLSGAASVVHGQRQSTRLPGESEAAYRTRLARMAAVQAARARATVRTNARDYYELRRYEIETDAQKAGFDAFVKEAAIPTLNRNGIDSVGVFYPWEGLSPIYVLLRHRSLASVAQLTQKLSEDEEFLQKGAAFLDAPAEKPAYKRMEIQLMVAFQGMKKLETPIENPGRVLQLRTYESPSVKTGQKKIEMFNTAEINIFRKTGLHPVFFGETLAGGKMPNLTYMLVFNDMNERKANWKRFGADPQWRALRAIPEYADKRILCGITNLYLKPASYSQI